MKDALGTEIVVGDILFHGETGRHAAFGTYKVSRLTAKTVFAMMLTSDRYNSIPFYSGSCIRIQNTQHCVVINKLLPDA